MCTSGTNTTSVLAGALPAGAALAGSTDKQPLLASAARVLLSWFRSLDDIRERRRPVVLARRFNICIISHPLSIELH